MNPRLLAPKLHIFSQGKEFSPHKNARFPVIEQEIGAKQDDNYYRKIYGDAIGNDERPLMSD